jgi:uncharacterized protein (TIGR02145 family)
MKTLLTLLFLLTALLSNAQNTLDNVGLTSATPASVAYSLRQLSNSYTGPLVRAKVGASFYDVYPDAITKKFSLSSKISASISTYDAGVAAASANALSTIISGSTNATVAIWYDQSGNAVHVLSNTSIAKIITAGSINTLYGQPTVYFSGNNGESLLTSSTTVDYSALSGATVNAVVQNVATTSPVGGIFGAAYAIANPGYNISYGGTGSGYLSDGAGCEYKTSFSSTSPQLVTNIFTNTTTNLSTTYINGELKTNSGSTCNLTHTSGSKIYIGSARGYGPFSFNGNISEAILFPSQLSDAVRNPLETNQTQTYFGPAVTIASSASGAVCAGTSVTFTATTYNFSSTPTLQWYKNGTALSGETNATYTTTSLSNNDQITVRATPATVSATTVTSNLIANLDAGNSSSYNGSGNSWTDLTGNGNNVALTNTGYSSVNGGGIALNTNGYGTQTLANSPFNGDFTWSTIFRFNEGMWDWIYNVGGYNGLVLTALGKPALSWGGWFNNKIDAGAEVALTNGNYYMLTFVRSGNAVFCYLQASPYGVGSNVSGNIGLVSPLIGKGPGGEAWPNGIVNLILVYNRALTQTEITQNYNTYAARFGLSPAAISSNTITASITGSAPILTVTGDGCANKTTLTVPTGATAYAWYKDNVAIGGATSNSYIPTAAGAYHVQVTTGSCTNASSPTTLYECGRTADGSMVVVEGSSSLISRDGSKNTGKGVDDRGKVVTKPWTYGTVTTATGRVWMDRNLGATRVATSSTDTQGYGDYYQWGRPADGHQTKYLTNNNSTGFTNTRSTTAVPSTDLWIATNDGSNDWLITADNTLWVGTNPANNPCPTGFRIPTLAEWQAEQARFASNNASGAFNYSLKLTMPGWLEGFSSSGAGFTATGGGGFYLTQTANTNGSVQYFGINSGNVWTDTNLYKRQGLSVRCIQNQ